MLDPSGYDELSIDMALPVKSYYSYRIYSGKHGLDRRPSSHLHPTTPPVYAETVVANDSKQSASI